jgi:hypothetical protein
MDTETPSKFLSDSWNKVATAVGTSADASGKRLQLIADRFRLPNLFEYLWMWPYWVEMFSIAKEWIAAAGEEIAGMARSVANLVESISEGPIPMPPHLKTKVMRGDEAMSYAIRALLRGSTVLVEEGQAKAGADALFGVTEPTLKIDPEARPTRQQVEIEIDRLKTKQNLWRSWLQIVFSGAILWLPVTAAYVAGVLYWRLWTDPSTSPTLAQDSKRVRGIIDKQAQRRQNARAGKDK